MLSKIQRKFVQKPSSIKQKQNRWREKKKIITKSRDAIKDIIFIMRNCKTQEEVIKYIKLHEIKTMDAIWKALDKGKEPPEDIQISTLWDFPFCDERFGIKHPGMIPGQIALNLLFFYTKEGDKILDPMAGGGSTIDVCKLMNRNIIAYDIAPMRDDIKAHDLTKNTPLDDNSVEFVFLDPPYWKQKKGEYSNNKCDLSNLSLRDFYKVIKSIAKESYRVLKPNGFVSFIISNINNTQDGFIDLGFESYKIFQRIGFVPIERMSIPYHHAASHTPLWKWRAIKNKFMLRGYRDLFVMQKVVKC